MMPSPLVYTWPYALVFWGVFVWAFAPEARVVSAKADRASASQDANSKRLIMIGQGVAMLAAFTIAARVPSGVLPHRVWCFWIGVGALAGGSLLRRHCFRMLGSSFTGAVIVRPDQGVVERGAYRYVRHPSYSAGMVLFAGIGIALGNWISLAVLVAAVGSVYAYRVRIEERALATIIGEPYLRYMGRTKRFVPFLF
ncbi:MAG TPA: isoprenylcysteine carboxylmethyltransferase family protein [Vicinamibacterales bacterium]|nr:isoprenylcysteine carboxylmethyltransferase family protein [Vicinamibacterales bacterium]